MPLRNAFATLTRDRFLPLAGVVLLCGIAWAYLAAEASDMAAMSRPVGTAGMGDMSGMPGMAGMPGMEGAPWTLTELGYLCVMWSIMMVAMMLPGTAPTILLVTRVGRARREQGRLKGPQRWLGITPVFVTGYLLAWTGYSVCAATAQWALHGTLLVSPAMVSVSPLLSGGLLVAAGAFQFTPLKHRCVTHCRSPLSFLTSHWREGLGGALRMGLHHGAYCVGCCWALMALLFVLGVMNLVWITALAVLVLLEKALPGGAWITRGIGVVLLGWGTTMLL